MRQQLVLASQRRHSDYKNLTVRGQGGAGRTGWQSPCAAAESCCGIWEVHSFPEHPGPMKPRQEPPLPSSCSCLRIFGHHHGFLSHRRYPGSDRTMLQKWQVQWLLQREALWEGQPENGPGPGSGEEVCGSTKKGYSFSYFYSFIYFLRWSFALVTQAGVQWRNLSSPHPLPLK